MFERIRIQTECDTALTRIADGETDEISVIYGHCAKKIYFLAKSITRNEADSEDVLQNTIVKIMSSAKSYKPGTNAVAWIMTVARTCAISFIREKHSDCPLDEAMEEVSDSDDHTKYTDLYDALDRLSSEERQIVIMKAQLGMKQKDIAQILGISAEASQKRYRRAVAKLNKYYSTRG